MYKHKKILWLILVGAALIALAASLGSSPAQAQGQTGSNWLAFYWNNRNFEGAPSLSRIDPVINFNWGSGSPAPGINADNFSVRWSNRIDFQAGTYRFRAGADDGIRVAINGQLIINRFTETPTFQVDTADVVLGAGQYEIIVDYFEATGTAGVLFDWTAIGGGQPGQPTPGLPPTPLFTPTAVKQVKAVVIVDVANVRSGPSLEFPTIAQIFRDEVYIATARNGDFGFETWYLIDLGGGRRGWASRSIIFLYNQDPATLPRSKEVIDVPPLPQPQQTGGLPAVGAFEVQGTARVNTLVRDAPSTRFGQKIGVINRGETFRILKLSQNRAWVLVEFNGLQGWTYLPNVRVILGNLSALPRGN